MAAKNYILDCRAPIILLFAFNYLFLENKQGTLKQIICFIFTPIVLTWLDIWENKWMRAVELAYQ